MEIEEPILLTIRSVTPPKQYKACPRCFANLEPEPTIEQKEAPEPTVEQKETMEEEDTSTHSVNTVLEKVKDSGPRFLKKFKSLIPSSNESQKEKKEKTKEPKAEPPVTKEEKKEKHKTEPSAKEETSKEAPKTRPPAEKGEVSSGCPQSFGYLANRPPDAPIPQECLVCPKIVECMLKVEE
jgi:hypothetical protein